jgi:glycine cleavage system H protein
MTEYLETTFDKFTFRVAADRLYTAQGVWARAEADGIRTGLSDFVQQRSGDIAFAEVQPEGTRLAAGGEVAVIETIKVNLSVSSPVEGRIVQVNPDLEQAPEVINQDPYGRGWIAILESSSWEADRVHLLDAAAYLEIIRHEAGMEA